MGRKNAPVEIIEEREEVEPELEEALRLVPRQRTENLRRIVHVVLVPYPAKTQTQTRVSMRDACKELGDGAYLLALKRTRGRLSRNAIHCPDRRKSSVRKAWATFSGNTNCANKG